MPSPAANVLPSDTNPILSLPIAVVCFCAAIAAASSALAFARVERAAFCAATSVPFIAVASLASAAMRSLVAVATLLASALVAIFQAAIAATAGRIVVAAVIPAAFQFRINSVSIWIASFMPELMKLVSPICAYITDAASPSFCHNPYRVCDCFTCIS